MGMRQWVGKVFDRLGIVTKFDLNEYARRFLAGDDPPGYIDDIVAPESAMRIAAVYACVRIRSETIASLPISIYRRRSDGGVEEARSHWAHRLLTRAPNRYQTPYEWKEQMNACIDLRGNGVSIKRRAGRRVVELVPVHPSRVSLDQSGGAAIYRVTWPDGRTESLLSDDVTHWRGMTTDGLWGLSPIAAAKDAVALARKVQQYGISVLDSGGGKRVLLKFPQPKTREFVDEISRRWREKGRDGAATAVLDDGGDATVIGMNADEAQYLETRRMTISDIARIYRVPLALLADHEGKGSTYASTEQFDLMFAKHTIRPICKRIESALDRDLLGSEADDYFCKFNLDALLRGDLKTRTESLKTEFMHGRRTLDEWRILEDMPPTGQEWGGWHFVPANLTPIERLIETPTAPPSSGGVGGSDNEERGIFEPFARDIAQRLVRAQIRGAANCKQFEEFRVSHRQYAYRAVQPLLEAAGLTEDSKGVELSGRIAAGMDERREVDIVNRETEIFALLMSVVTPEERKSTSWAMRSVVAAQAQKLAVEPAGSPVDWSGDM